MKTNETTVNFSFSFSFPFKNCLSNFFLLLMPCGALVDYTTSIFQYIFFFSFFLYIYFIIHVAHCQTSSGCCLLLLPLLILFWYQRPPITFSSSVFFFCFLSRLCKNILLCVFFLLGKRQQNIRHNSYFNVSVILCFFSFRFFFLS